MAEKKKRAKKAKKARKKNNPMRPSRPMSGVLWTNWMRQDELKRQAHSDLPHRRGRLTIVCPFCKREAQFYQSAWDKMGRRGPYLSIAYDNMPNPVPTYATTDTVGSSADTIVNPQNPEVVPTDPEEVITTDEIIPF